VCPDRVSKQKTQEEMIFYQDISHFWHSIN